MAAEHDHPPADVQLVGVVTLPGSPSAAPAWRRMGRRWLWPDHHPDEPVSDDRRRRPMTALVVLAWAALVAAALSGSAGCGSATAGPPGGGGVVQAAGLQPAVCGELHARAAWPAVARGVRKARDPLVARISLPVLGGEVHGMATFRRDGVPVREPGVVLVVERVDGGIVTVTDPGVPLEFNTSAEQATSDLQVRVEGTTASARAWLKQSCHDSGCDLELRINAAFGAEGVVSPAVRELWRAWEAVSERYAEHDGRRAVVTSSAARAVAEARRALLSKSCPLGGVTATLEDALLAIQRADAVAAGLFDSGEVPPGAAREVLNVLSGLQLRVQADTRLGALWTPPAGSPGWADPTVRVPLWSVAAVEPPIDGEAPGVSEHARQQGLAWARVFAAHDPGQLLAALRLTGSLDAEDPRADLTARLELLADLKAQLQQRAADQAAGHVADHVEERPLLVVPSWLDEGPELAVAEDFPVGEPPWCLGADGTGLVSDAAAAKLAIFRQFGLDPDGLHLRSLPSMRDDLAVRDRIGEVVCDVPVVVEVLGGRKASLPELAAALREMAQYIDWSAGDPADPAVAATRPVVVTALCGALSTARIRSDGVNLEGLRSWYDGANELIPMWPAWLAGCPDATGVTVARPVAAIQVDLERVFVEVVRRIDAPSARPRAVEGVFGPLPDAPGGAVPADRLLLPVPVPFAEAEIQRWERAVCSGGEACGDLARVVGDPRLHDWFPGRTCGPMPKAAGPPSITVGRPGRYANGTLSCANREYAWSITIASDAGSSLRVVSEAAFSVDGLRAACGSGRCALQRPLSTASTLSLRVKGTRDGQEVSFTSVADIR